MHIHVHTFIFASFTAFLWKVRRFGNPCYLAAWDLGRVAFKVSPTAVCPSWGKMDWSGSQSQWTCVLDHVRSQVRIGPSHLKLTLIYSPRLSESNLQGGDVNPIVPLSHCLDLQMWENVLGLEALKALAWAEQLSVSIGQAAKVSICTAVLIQSHFSSTSVTVKGCKLVSYTKSLTGPTAFA